MAFNSFRKHCSNVLTTVLCFVCNNFFYDYGQDFSFYHKTEHKVADKTLEQQFLEEFKAKCNLTSSESELKHQVTI